MSTPTRTWACAGAATATARSAPSTNRIMALFSRSGLVEFQGRAVHAIPKARRLGPVVEHVAEVASAAPAVGLRARHEEAPIGGGADRPVDRRPKARPAGAAVELRGRLEQRQVAPGAGECATRVLLVQGARAGGLGSVLAEHPVLLGRQRRPPLGVGLRDLERLGLGHRKHPPPTRPGARSRAPDPTPSATWREARSPSPSTAFGPG